MDARHWLLLMMVLSENTMLLSVHHETASVTQVFTQRQKRWLIIAAALAFSVHMIALHLPFFSDFLGATDFQWPRLFETMVLALGVALGVESLKRIRTKWN